MATYPTISTLTGLNTTPGLSNPSDADNASELAAADRQIRSFLATFLSQAHADNGTLKTDAVVAASIPDRSIAAVKIALLAITEAELANATITTGKIANLAITAALLAADAVTTAKILDANVTAAKLATDSVIEAKILNSAVTANKIAAGAVTSGKIGALAVGTAALAANAVSTAKIENIGEGKVLVGNGTDVTACTIGGDITAVRSGSTLNLSITGGGTAAGLQFARIVETGVSGTNGGATTAGAWENRGSTVGWDKSGQDPAAIVDVSTYKLILDAGQYYIRAAIPGYSCGSFKTRLVQDPSGTPAYPLYGSNGAAAPGNIGQSLICGLLTVAADNTEFSIQQYSEFAEAAGMGLPQSIAAVNEVYTVIELIRYA